MTHPSSFSDGIQQLYLLFWGHVNAGPSTGVALKALPSAQSLSLTPSTIYSSQHLLISHFLLCLNNNPFPLLPPHLYSDVQPWYIEGLKHNFCSVFSILWGIQWRLSLEKRQGGGRRRGWRIERRGRQRRLRGRREREGR